MRDVIFYIGTFKMPDLNAAATRVLGIGKCLNELGYKVVFQGNQIDSDHPENVCTYYYNGFTYKTRKRWSNKEYYLDPSFAIDTINEIGSERIYALIMYHPSAVVAMKLKRYCDSKGIKTVSDITEWYDIKRQLYNGHTWVKALDFWARVYFVNPKIKNIIAISRYLQNYYDKKGAKTIRIPILKLSSNLAEEITKTDEVVELCYCGSPSKKDLLLPIIEAVKDYIDSNKGQISLKIIGSSLHEFEECNQYAISKKYLENISFYGRLPHEAALALLKQSDYSFIIRPNLRYAIAGFPTKLVEAFSCGVAVIACSNGDISECVTDGINGYLVDPNDIKNDLNRVLGIISTLTIDDIITMKKEAYASGEKYFAYSKYTDLVGEYLRGI